MIRNVCSKFWVDAKVRQLTFDERAVFLYLLTNPHTHLCGLYWLPLTYADHELGRKIDWGKFFVRLKDMVTYDYENEIVWVHKMYSYQGRGVNIARHVAKYLSGQHPSETIKSFIQTYPIVKPWISKEFMKGVPHPLVPPLGRGSDTDTVLSSLNSSLNSPDSELEKEVKTEPEKLTMSLDEIRTQWNAIPGVKPVKSITGVLLTKINKLRKEKPVTWWTELFQEVAASKFLTGQTQGNGHQPFHVSLDWATGPINSSKIFAGNYSDLGATTTTKVKCAL